MPCNFEIIIPAAGRSSVVQVVQHLLSTPTANIPVRIVTRRDDAASSFLLCQRNVTLDFVDSQEFCKAAWLNIGIRNSHAKILLISDADILWEVSTLDAMVHAVKSQRTFCCVADVIEADQTQQIEKPTARFRPLVSWAQNCACVSIEPDIDADANPRRPGPGLVMSLRECFIDVGGYNENLVGWGWEDHDLLVRAELLGYNVQRIGTVTHLTHEDTLRNQYFGFRTKEFTRNKNIAASMAGLDQQILRGPLNPVNDRLPTRVVVKPLPEDWDVCESKS